MGKIIDLLGHDFERLHVVGKHSKRGSRWLWECLCECGNTTKATSWDLRSGHTKSCGCLRKELNAMAGFIDGRMKSDTWKTWRAMKVRCLYPSNPSYKNYGGRGIAICPRWLDFKNFYEDMGERPEGMTIDRINVNGNYEPDNCRWATRKQQQQNKRASVYGEEVDEV